MQHYIEPFPETLAQEGGLPPMSENLYVEIPK